MTINRLTVLASIFLGGSIARGGSYTATILYNLEAPGGISIQPRQVTADGTIGFGPFNSSSIPPHALLWSPPDGTATDLNPTGLGDAASSEARGAFGNQQVGSYGSDATAGFSHAVLWSGTAASALDLNPTQLGMFASLANATDGNQQAGRGTVGTPMSSSAHAVLWTNTAASAVDLNPSQFGPNVGSVALGLTDGQEVGEYHSPTIPTHAMLWTGTANSAIDLHPSDPTLKFSDAVATSGNQQVGVARANGGGDQAFLWFGSAASAVNLNPTTLPGIDSSFAVATNGLQQVGSGFTDSVTVNDDQALIWSGTANSAIDLQPTLPSSGTWNFSDAYSIDSAGNVFGAANGTMDGFTGYFAVEWSPVPEPSSTLLLAVTASALLNRRRPRISAKQL
jgi:hypothetical protein